jgi:hypothetical protein
MKKLSKLDRELLEALRYFRVISIKLSLVDGHNNT